MYGKFKYIALALLFLNVSVCGASLDQDSIEVGSKKKALSQPVTLAETTITTLVHLGTDAALATALAVEPLKPIVPLIQGSRAISLTYADYIALKAAKQNPDRANIAFATILLFHTLADAAQATPEAFIKAVAQLVQALPILPAIVAAYESFMPPSAILAALTAASLVYIFFKESGKPVAVRDTKTQNKRAPVNTDIRGKVINK